MVDALPALLRGRIAAESLMLATCTITRPTGGTVTDPETWDEVPEVVPVEGARGICKVQSSVPRARDNQDGEARVTIESPQVHLPVGDPVQSGDLVTVVADPIDPLNDGRVYRLSEPSRGTWRTAQRWNVEEV